MPIKRILAIETSCDDTGVAILEIPSIDYSHGRTCPVRCFLSNGVNISRVPRSGTSERFSHAKLLADLVSSQVKIHAPWGGVVPTLAKREHQRNLLPLLKRALDESKLLKISKSKFLISKQIPNHKFQIPKQSLNSILEREPELLKKLLPFLKKYSKPDIDYIAVTVGPGLEPALWVGVNFARALGFFWNLPIIPVNHVESHITANWLSQKNNAPQPPLRLRGGEGELFPAICLVVSGGHTQLILMRDFGKYKILGETRDDAAGEAFDKVAKMLGLGYPGGPIISRIAQSGDPLRPKTEIKFPRPMIDSKNYDFSFSGLKTAVLYLVKKLKPAQIKKLTPAICAEFQQAVIDVLVAKTIRAAKKLNAKTILLSGGVAANDLLRKTLELETLNLKLNFSVPPKNFCTDNAAMVALAVYLKNAAQKKRKTKRYESNWKSINVAANLKIA